MKDHSLPYLYNTSDNKIDSNINLYSMFPASKCSIKYKIHITLLLYRSTVSYKSTDKVKSRPVMKTYRKKQAVYEFPAHKNYGKN